MFDTNWNLVGKIEINSDKNNYYCALNLKNKLLEEKSFLIIKSIDSSDDEDDDDDESENISTNKYELHIGDVIKLGRVPLKIRNLCINGQKVINKFIKNKNLLQRINTNFTNNNNNNNNNEININNNENEIITERKKTISNSKKKKTCRICYCDDIEVNSPLITPCKCTGGLKYIHLKCLQNWIHAQSLNLSEESNNFCLVYNVKQISCEICKEKYPDFIYLNENDNNNILDIFDFVENKFDSYIILESYFKNNFKNIFVLSCDSHNVISIGRSHETNLRINDITVSRFHSEIIKENNKFYIRDLYSKFGTGILLQNNKIKIKEDFPLYIQIGKNIMEIKIEKKCFCCYKFFNCLCLRKNFNNKIFNYYGKENAEKINIENVFDFQEIDKNNEKDEDDSSITSINRINKEQSEEFNNNNNNNNKIIQIQNNNEKENEINNNLNIQNDFDAINNKLILNNNKNLTINTNSSNHNLTTLTMSMSNSTQNKNNKKMKKINITQDLNKNAIKNKLIIKNNNDDIMEEDFKENDIPNDQINDCIQIYNNNNSNRELLKDISINNDNNKSSYDKNNDD